MDLDFCDICGFMDWDHLRGGWKRCLVCGHLDTDIPERACKKCGRPIGRFAKVTMSVCTDCKSYSGYPEKDFCITPFCGGKVRPQQKTQHCDGCLYEQEHWETPNGPTWKKAASEVFRSPTQVKTAHEQLKSSYPELSRYKLEEWIRRHKRLEFLVRVDHGIYQMKGTEDD